MPDDETQGPSILAWLAELAQELHHDERLETQRMQLEDRGSSTTRQSTRDHLIRTIESGLVGSGSPRSVEQRPRPVETQLAEMENEVAWAQQRLSFARVVVESQPSIGLQAPSSYQQDLEECRALRDRRMKAIDEFITAFRRATWSESLERTIRRYSAPIVEVSMTPYGCVALSVAQYCSWALGARARFQDIDLEIIDVSPDDISAEHVHISFSLRIISIRRSSSNQRHRRGHVFVWFESSSDRIRRQVWVHASTQP